MAAAAAAVLLSACQPGRFAASLGNAARPNVVVVPIDGMGYGDLSAYGERRVSAPNIDRLAREGTHFTRYYANPPICSPSRVALTTVEPRR